MENFNSTDISNTNLNSQPIAANQPMQMQNDMPQNIENQYNPSPILENKKPSNSFSYNSFFASLNWVEITFGIIGSAALFYTIYYYRYKIQIDKLFNNNLQKQINTLNLEIEEIKQNNTQQNDFLFK